MATKAKTTAKSRQAKATAEKARSTAKKPVRAAKTNAKTEVETVVAAPVVTPVTRQKTYQLVNEPDLAPALLAEMVGTFILTASIAATRGDAFFTGLTLIMIVIAIFAISGAHVNPAVSFGLWSMRKLRATRMFMYWIAQFVGAVLAFLTVSSFASSKTQLSFAHFTSLDWKIFSAELIGMTIFMFGIAAAAHRAQTDHAKAVGIGLSLVIGLVVATGFLSQAINANTKQDNQLARVNNVALNPAVAFTLTEKTGETNPLTGETAKSDKTPVSRIGLETILGALAGAALGGNLYWLLSRARVEQEDQA